MTIYYCSHTGDNGAGTSKSTAKTTLAAAIALLTNPGDGILINAAHTGDNALSSDTTYTLPAGTWIRAVNWTTDAPEDMGTAAWIGSSSASVALTFTAAGPFGLHGLTLRNAGALSKNISIVSSDGGAADMGGCYLWLGTTSTTAIIALGSGQSNYNEYVSGLGVTFRFGHASQSLAVRAKVKLAGGGVSSAGTAPSALINFGTAAGTLEGLGLDLSHLGANPIVGSLLGGSNTVLLQQCLLGASYTVLQSTTPASMAGAEVSLMDCHSGDTHGIVEYHTALGSLTTDATRYVTAGPAGVSYKIVTTSDCGVASPFITPWVPGYNSTTGVAVTPYFELLRDGSATAFTSAEMYAQFGAKVNSGSTRATLADGYAGVGVAGTDLATGTGLANWTGEGGTASSLKAAISGTLTPAEVGDISGRLVVCAPSLTVYLDPYWRT